MNIRRPGPHTWHVYGLIDPRDREFFYFGCTITPRGRATNHCTDPGSAAYCTVKEIHAAGLKCILKVLARYPWPEKFRAFAHEGWFIASTPTALNRTQNTEAVLQHLPKLSKPLQEALIARARELDKEQKAVHGHTGRLSEWLIEKACATT